MSWSNTATIEKTGFAWAVVLVVAVSWGTVVSEAVAGAMPEDDPQSDCGQCYRIDAIVIDGLLRTDRAVVERELLFEEGDVTSVEEVEESVQRLRNTGIFREVDYELSDRIVGAYGEGADSGVRNDGGRLLRLDVDERFTISPSFRFGQGGDTLHLLLGVQDVNIAGSFLQGGLRYSRLGDANSFSAWFREPRFLDARQQLELRAGVNNRLFTLYEPDGDIEGGYLHTRRNASVEMSREFQRWLRTGIHASASAHTFSYDMVTDDRRRRQQQRGGLYGPSQTVGFGATVRLGRIDTFEHRSEGTSLLMRGDQNFHFGDHAPTSWRFLTRLHHYQHLPLDITLATRAQLGFQSSTPSYRQFFAGGLDTLRGTYDNRYRGAHHWFANAELRVPTFENRWLLVQSVGFLDAVRVAGDPSGIAGLTAATTGVGLRFISRDFHSMIVRIDYAPPVMGADGPGLSFGAGQFF